ncbi:MAG: RagB/SusD family nutrient uptake outer membrane protein [Prevotellaceae bacterium]|jgi:hypothetical protein|nr:RagB/SusD family nutrient uptake outer membrane protein [Prevotellaceae bacterium]
MKTITKNIIMIFFAIAMLSLVACEKLLDIEQHGVETFETFYQTDEQADEAITAVYANFSTIYYNYWFIKNLLSDDFWSGGGNRGDNASNESLNEYTFNHEHTYLEGTFTSYYTVIYLSNIIFGHVPQETAIQKRAHAEAKVFRAFAYIDLISMWGTPPLVDHELSPSEYKLPNGDPDALWTLVETDLTEAIESGLLREKSDANDASSYRVTKQFAQALLGKAYVFQEKWSEAITVLDQVINSNKYDLYPDYENILQYTVDNCCESLFEINRLNDPNNAFTNWTLFAAMTGWRTDHMKITSEIYDGTWGFCNPQKDLYDAFVAEEGENGYRLNATMKSYDKVLEQGDTITDPQGLYGHEGYFIWKSRIVAGEMIAGGWMSSHNNLRFMRFAEILLLAAEAHLKGGGSKATEYVNRVRTRAQLTPKGSVTMNDIMTEKRLELCGESVRYQDMIRWRIATKMSAQGTQTPTFYHNGTVSWISHNDATEAGFKERHWLLPFPQTELTVNSNVIQNEGW